MMGFVEVIQRYMGNSGWILLGLMIATVMERVVPARRYEDYWPRQFVRDLGWFAVAGAMSKLVDPFNAFLRTQLPTFHIALSADSVVLQVIMFMVIGDFFIYWLHRAMHSYSAIGMVLWRGHSWHHEMTSMTALSGYQGSFVHRLLHALAGGAVPAIFVDVRSPITWSIIVVLFMVIQLFTHSNTRLHLGPLSWLIVTPGYHRVHHARDARLHTSNFGNLFTIWDRLFGTYRSPHELGDLPLGIEEPCRNRVARVIGV